MNRRNLLLGAAAAAACAPAGSTSPAPPFPMRRGVNLGNALEAPNEGEWGYRIEADHLRAIADAGFDGVRVPVRWDERTAIEPPYSILPFFRQRIMEIVETCVDLGLRVQIDCHHYNALIDTPDTERARFLGIWRNVATLLRDAPPEVIFEPLNEAHGARWSGAALRDLQAQAVAAIRDTNPTRLVVVGPGRWQHIDALDDWRPPQGENIAVSVHYYEPHAFTHQGADWLPSPPHFDRAWGTRDDRQRVMQDMARAARWGAARGFSMQLGEFGVNAAAPIQQRAAWTRMVREACEANGMGWCIWDFAGAFPIFDRESGAFIPLMRDALFA